MVPSAGNSTIIARKSQRNRTLDPGDEGRILKQYHELAELAGSLAHEIKNPLSVIHMNADLLSEEMSESEWPGKRRAESKVEMIRQQCQRMENLLRDFLRFSRLRDEENAGPAFHPEHDSGIRSGHAEHERSLGGV